MNLVKWFRKNRTKLMAVVVIVIMIGFIGGSALSYLLQRGPGLRETVAYFGQGRKITNYDLALARRELEILGMLRIDQLLRSQDLQGIVLAELLFSEGRASPLVINRMKRTIRTNRYGVSDRQINDIYRRSMPTNVYWLLLRDEAELAGIRIRTQDVGTLLARIIPQLFNEQTYSQVMEALIARMGISEQQLLATVGRLLAVLQYAEVVCSLEAVTNSQIRHAVSRENETIDVELLKFDSAVFAETQDEPNEQEMLEHFNKYKGYFEGNVTEANPYGFGYKLPDQVQLEYLAVKLDDVSQIVTAPTYEEMEQYYQNHTEQFTESVPTDPNDPNSPLIERTRSYAEVASDISEQLRQDKINSKAESILQEAKTLTEAGLQDIDTDVEEISAEQFKQLAGDYTAVAEKLAEKHNIKIYSGQTGLLGAVDVRADLYLRSLYLARYGHSPLQLSKLIFSVGELQASELGPFDVRKPRLYENIGPVKDLLGAIMAIVRVVKAEKASEPQDINQTFSKRTLEFEKNQPETEEVYSIREKVAEDLKKLAAMDTTKRKAQEFIDLAEKESWDGALDKFNELYGKQVGQDESDPNVFKLRTLTDLRRISSATLATLATQSEGDPGQRLLVTEAEMERWFVDQLYSLVPQDSNTVDAVPLVMEFEPQMSFYVIKNISIKRLRQDEYEQVKPMEVYRQDRIATQSLSVVHFNPENILKRLNFKPAKQPGETPDANEPTPSEETS
jgi:hypothetical protein